MAGEWGVEWVGVSVLEGLAAGGFSLAGYQGAASVSWYSLPTQGQCV